MGTWTLINKIPRRADARAQDAEWRPPQSPPPGRWEGALWWVSTLVRELLRPIWRSPRSLLPFKLLHETDRKAQGIYTALDFFAQQRLVFSTQLATLHRSHNASPTGTRKGEIRAGTPLLAYSGTGKIMSMAIIFNCLLFARRVPTALDGLPHLLLTKPHRAGTVTSFHWQETSP